MGANLDAVKLLEVLVLDLQSLSKSFLDYDTDEGEYKLPKKGLYMMLIFEKNIDKGELNLFTTLRRYTPAKAEYYKSKIGKLFNVEIMEVNQ